LPQASRTLADIAGHLNELEDGDTIYVAQDAQWTPSSAAMVSRAPGDGSMPPAADGSRYFLEVYLAKEVIDVWREWRGGREPTLVEMCEALIFYASRDAYLPVDAEER
jgi:hypothetical protein